MFLMKLLKITLLALICFCSVLSSTGCSTGSPSSEYPVTFGDSRFEVAPAGIICLSKQISAAADYLGYSDRCITGEFGTDYDPDFDAILNARPEVVITANDFIYSQQEKFAAAGIKICKRTLPQTFFEYKEFLLQLGSFFGGNITGLAVAQKVADDIDESVTNVKAFIKTKPAVNYLVFYEQNKCAAKGDYLIDLLTNCGLEGYTNTDYFWDDQKIISQNPQAVICTENAKSYFLQEKFSQCEFYKNNAVYLLDISQATGMGADTLSSIYRLFEQMYPDFLNEGKNNEV